MEKITNHLSCEPIVMVRFIATGEVYFFGSYAAIYEMFTAEQIGCPVGSLWQKGLIDYDRPFTTAHCVISRVRVYRKRQRQRFKS